MSALVVGLMGTKGCGKTTVAHAIRKQFLSKSYVMRFADPIKNVMRVLGLTPDEVDGANKEEPCMILGGKTPRFAMQTLGTEWGREIIDQDVWVNVWRHELHTLLHKTRPYEDIVVVTDDVRFPNEVRAIRDVGGAVVWLERPSVYTGGDVHASETSVGPSEADFIIKNLSTPELAAEDVVRESRLFLEDYKELEL